VYSTAIDVTPCLAQATLGSLLDAGMSVLRFNFSHGDHKGHFQVLERFRKVCSWKSYRFVLEVLVGRV